MRGAFRARRTWAWWTTATLLLVTIGVPEPGLGGSTAEPEIEDAVDDANPAAFALNDEAHADLFAPANLSAYDLRAVYILRETQDDVYLRFLVKDLPDGWGPPLSAVEDNPLDPSAQRPFITLMASFEIRGQAYEVNASLAMLEGNALVDEYTLHRGNAWIHVEGAYNTTENSVTVRLEKALLEHPDQGDRLINFWSKAEFDGLPLDFAPDAENVADDDPTPGGVLRLVLELLQGPQLVEPTYGRDYAFGQYGGERGEIELYAATAVRNVLPGGSTTFTVEIRNEGWQSERVILTLGSAPTGWHHALGTGEVDVPAGSTETVRVTVTAPRQVGSVLFTRLLAGGSSGATDELTLRTEVTQDGGPPPPTSPPPPPSTSGAPESDEGKDNPLRGRRSGRTSTPGFEPLALLAALGIGATLLRRRA